MDQCLHENLLLSRQEKGMHADVWSHSTRNSLSLMYSKDLNLKT